MDKLSTLQTFLASIRPVSIADYQIRNTTGEVLFATKGSSGMGLDAGTAEIFCNRLLERNTFAYDVVEPRRFLCGRPLAIDDRTRMLLLAYGPFRNGPPSEEHRRRFKIHLDSAVALAAEKIDSQAKVRELTRQLEHSFEDIYLYDRITSQIKSLQLSEQVLRHLMIEIVENMQADAAFVTLPCHPEYNIQIVRPETADRLDDAETFLTDLESMARPEIDSPDNNWFILNDSRGNPDSRRLAPTPYRFLMVGVRHRQQLFGWLGLVTFNLNEIFRRGELRMLKTMAEHLAIVIDNTNLYTDLKQFTVNMVSSLISAVEARDAFIRGHSERVHRYAMMLAQAYGLKGNALEALKWAAILHDVGKISVPERILRKPEKLTEEELACIKEHPEKGHKILRSVAQLTPSLGGILHHHERYDGRGYPHSLSGDEIPLAARMIAVADTFDAFTSNRPYHSPKSRQEAMAIIESMAGTQLDPNMVALFKKLRPATGITVAQRRNA